MDSDAAADVVMTYLADAEPEPTPLAEACAAAGDRADAGFAAYLAAGTETTMTLLSQLLLYWLDHRPDVSTPAARAAVVDEVLRLQPPANVATRFVPEDCRLGDRTLQADQVAHVVIAAANRDPVRFREPHAFRPGRPEQGLMFGHGSHYCAGAALARLQGDVLLELLAEHASGWYVAGTVEYDRNVLMRHVTRLPVGASPSAGSMARSA